MAEVVPLGYGNWAVIERMLGIAKFASAPIKRLVRDRRERGFLIDATSGRRTRAVLISDCGFLILSALSPETILRRAMR
jgi:hypothetical protein